MKKSILTIVLLFLTFGLFAQKSTPSDEAVLKMMNVKKGMTSVNSLANQMSEKMDAKNVASFKKEMETYKQELINTALATFKKDYTAEEMDAIYKECTSDKIDYSDLTNGFFRKWRQLKANIFFRRAKETYFKYQ